MQHATKVASALGNSKYQVKHLIGGTSTQKGEHILFGRNVLCEEQCANLCAAAEADLMSGITIEHTFNQITSCNAFHVDLYYCLGLADLQDSWTIPTIPLSRATKWLDSGLACHCASRIRFVIGSLSLVDCAHLFPTRETLELSKLKH